MPPGEETGTGDIPHGVPRVTQRCPRVEVTPGGDRGLGGGDRSPPAPFLLRCRISLASLRVTPAGATTRSLRLVITWGHRDTRATGIGTGAGTAAVTVTFTATSTVTITVCHCHTHGHRHRHQHGHGHCHCHLHCVSLSPSLSPAPQAQGRCERLPPLPQISASPRSRPPLPHIPPTPSH